MGKVSSGVLSDVQLVARMGACALMFLALGWAVGQGAVDPRCRLMFSWWCVCVSVRRFCGFVLGGIRFLQCNDANVVFRVCCNFASQSRPSDVNDGNMQRRINRFFFYFHPAPQFFKEC